MCLKKCGSRAHKTKSLKTQFAGYSNGRDNDLLSNKNLHSYKCPWQVRVKELFGALALHEVFSTGSKRPWIGRLPREEQAAALGSNSRAEW